jgi:hypothetical protein
LEVGEIQFADLPHRKPVFPISLFPSPSEEISRREKEEEEEGGYRPPVADHTARATENIGGNREKGKRTDAMTGKTDPVSTTPPPPIEANPLRFAAIFDPAYVEPSDGAPSSDTPARSLPKQGHSAGGGA